MLHIFAFACLAAIAIFPARAEADPIDDLIQHAMAQAHIPGAAVAIVRNGRVDRISSYGTASIESSASVASTTSFQIASASKMYTSVLLMRMVEQHKIGLDDSVAKYLADVPPAWRSVTIRNLASHTSGLGSPDLGNTVVATADAVRAAYPIPVRAAPGEQADYSSFDFPILQLILERISGKTFAQLINDELFVPAGMTCTAFDNAEDRGPQRVADTIAGRAEYYRWTGASEQRRWFLYAKWAYAAGGAYSCAPDVARFIAQIDAGTLVSKDSILAMETPTRLLDGTRADFGVGWVTGTYRGHRWMGHSGGPAFSDVMYFPSDHLGIIVLTNQQRMYPQLASLIADQYINAPRHYTSSGQKDRAPALTAAARQLFESASRGAIDGALFAPGQRDDYVSDLDDLGPVWFGMLPPVKDIILLRDETSGANMRIRSYRVLFGDHAEAIKITYDKDGKIAAISAHGD